MAVVLEQRHGAIGGAQPQGLADQRELRFSQVVYVVETTSKKDFTLVEWRSDDGTASLKGWVFSRYLKKFG